jgi:hypothetical protein
MSRCQREGRGCEALHVLHFLWGGMFLSGETALQADCGGCDPHPLHHFVLQHVCGHCSKPLEGRQKKFCSNQCQRDLEFVVYIDEWKRGLRTGNSCRAGEISHHVRRYMLEKAGHGCQNCSWGEVNPTTGKSPLTVHHVDGDCERTVESNLSVLCPNCHSLTPTYGALNRGSGRAWRRK